MIDRQPTKPGRIKLTDDKGNVQYYYMERADEPTVVGTPINKATLFDDDNSARTGGSTPSEGFDAILKDWGTFTIPLSGWSSSTSNGWYTYRIDIPGMKAAFNPFVDVLYESGATANEVSASFVVIKEIETFDGYVICKAVERPAVTIKIRITGV